MPSYSVSASEIKYASGSSWTSGKARQGVYSSTRYEGALNFAGLANFSFSNIAITGIQMRVTFGPTGGSSTKYLTLYGGAKNSISGSIASMRGSALGAVSVSNAFDRTVTLNFNSGSEAAIYNALVNFFTSGNRVLILYVPKTRGTYSGGYCYDYLSVTAMTLTFTYEYLQSSGSMASASVAAGSAAKLNITAYNSAYSHRVTWKFGDSSAIQTVTAGVSSASYTIPLNWLKAIPNAASGTASATLETLDTGGNVLGTSSYNFTVTVPAGVTPNLESVTVAPVNSNSVLAGWNAYAYGKSQAKITINGASGAYGSTIKSYSITTDPSVGSANASSLTTGTLYKTGKVNVTAKVTDSRGRTATRSATFSISAYAAPVISGVTLYRCKSDGTRDDAAGTCAYVKANFSCSAIGSNKVSVQAVLSQIGGSYTTSTILTSGSGVILGGGKLAVDATYSVTITATDTVGSVSTYSGEDSSAAYIMHVKKGGRALGFGMAAGADGTASFGWPLILSKPLAVAQGGTGANTASGACSAIGAVKKSGDTMSGNLNIATSLYPSLYLLPTYNSTTNRTVFEGSYIGASSFSSWEDGTGNNRRMLEVRNAAYQASLDFAVLLRTCTGGTWASYRLFHAGMATPIPLANGGTGASSAKAALSNLGIFYSASLPSSGTDGQICLVPV